jgi:hypothetical protein
MPSKSTVVDLTGDSSDDDSRKKNARSAPSAQTALRKAQNPSKSSPVKSKFGEYSKSSHGPKPTAAGHFSDRASSQGSSGKSHAGRGGTQTKPVRPPVPNGEQTSKQRQPLSASDNRSKDVSTLQRPEVKKGEMNPLQEKRFTIPRISQTFSDAIPLDSSPVTKSMRPNKRARDTESTTPGDRQSKKQKVTGDAESSPIPGRGSHGSSESPRKHGKASNETIDLTLSPPSGDEARESLAQDFKMRKTPRKEQRPDLNGDSTTPSSSKASNKTQTLPSRTMKSTDSYWSTDKHAKENLSKAASRSFDADIEHTKEEADRRSGSRTAPEKSPRKEKSTLSDDKSASQEERNHSSEAASLQDKSTCIDESKKRSDNSKSRRDVISGQSIHEEQASRVQHEVNVAEEADRQLRSEAMESMEHEHLHKQAATDPPKALEDTLRRMREDQFLTVEQKVEAVLGRHLAEMAEDNEYWNRELLERARLEKKEAGTPAGKTVKPVSFEHMKPIPFTQVQPGQKIPKNMQLWKVDRDASKAPGPAVDLITPYTTFSSDTPDVPEYSYYVSIKNNILAPNVKVLHCWPYFGDDFDINEAQTLKEQYKLDIENRGEKLLYLSKAQSYEPYAQGALEELGCTWADVLRALILGDDVKDIQSPQKAGRKGGKTSKAHQEEVSNFSPGSEWARDLLKSLPDSEPGGLTRAKHLCREFMRKANFSLWHIARRSDVVEAYVNPPQDEARETSIRDLTCRICLRFNCPYHGELKEHHPDDQDDAGSVDTMIATDIVHPPDINHPSRVSFPAAGRDPHALPDFRSKARKKTADYWQQPSLYKNAAERGPIYPCYHPGQSCSDNKCCCFRQDRPCEKICGCAGSCVRRFQGCKCEKKGLTCWNDPECACWQIGRECDPDLCGDCGVCEVLSPLEDHTPIDLKVCCHNSNIQKGTPKHTLLGDSGVHGFGLYAAENIRLHDFIGEYKGEIITKEEGERRSAVYECQKSTYLFNLNPKQDIDSTFFGNKMRFINCAYGRKANVQPYIILVNSVHRIGLYAKEPIAAGQELLFDYGKEFGSDYLEKKAVPQVRNPNLVNAFFDVQREEDEAGNERMKAVKPTAKGRKGSRKSKKRPRGGARAGAGRKVKPDLKQQVSSEPDPFDIRQDAGERLAAYNISDDGPSDLMDVDVNGGADDDDEYLVEEDEEEDEDEYDSDGSRRSAGQDDSGLSDSDDEDDQNEARTSSRRNGVDTRARRR